MADIFGNSAGMSYVVKLSMHSGHDGHEEFKEEFMEALSSFHADCITAITRQQHMSMNAAIEIAFLRLPSSDASSNIP